MFLQVVYPGIRRFPISGIQFPQITENAQPLWAYLRGRYNIGNYLIIRVFVLILEFSLLYSYSYS